MSTISLLGELERELSTLEFKSCVLKVLNSGRKQVISKQANSKMYNPLDIGVEGANMQKSQETESPATTPHTLPFVIGPKLTLPLMSTRRPMM